MSVKNLYSYQPNFMLIPSLSCPASCRYCFGPNTGPAMDIATVNHVLNFVKSIAAETGQGKVRVTLHGGEPLAAGYDVVEALISGLNERCRGIGLDIGVQSNLWLLDERYCALFRKYGVSLSTSLDGPKEINDAQRGDGYFEKTMRGIKLARANGLVPGCIATFTAQTVPRWKEVFDFFMSQRISFSVHPSVAAIGRHTEMKLTPGQYEALFHDMFAYYLQNRKRIKIESYDQICQGIACNEGRVCTFRDCFGMFLAVDPHGDIYSCQRFVGRPEYRLGNIAGRPTMNDLINSTAAQKLLERERSLREQCGSCRHYGYCKGGCPYNAAASDQPDAVDPYCEAYKKVFSMVSGRLYDEMVSDENFLAVAELGPSDRGNPLLRVGVVTDLTDDHAHPLFVANTARRIVTAYALAKAPDVYKAALQLVETGTFKSKQTAWAALETLRSDMQPSDRLNKLYLHVTWRCQLKCSHCYASSDDDDAAEEMSVDSIATMARDAARCGFTEVVLTGGEPLLLRNRDLLLRKLAALRWDIKPVKLVLRTNFAMPLSPDDHMLLAGAFDEIVVSVDGGRNEHDLRRGAGSYDKTVRNLELYTGLIGETMPNDTGKIRSARLSISGTMKAAQANEESGFAVKELGRRLNIRHVKFRPLLPLGRTLETGEPVVSEALRSYLSPIELLKEGFHPVHTCGIGQNLYVEPSGESFPCYSYHKPHSFLGNVIEEGLYTVIKSERFRALRESTVDTNYSCKSCEYRYLCGGACRAWGGESSQYDLNAAPVECEGLKKRAERLYEEASRYLSAN